MDGVNSVSHLVQFLAWSFLPPIISYYLRVFIYKFGFVQQPRVEQGATQAQIDFENSKARRHDKNIRIFLVTAYLTGTLASCYYYQSTLAHVNHYNLLGISRADVEAEGVLNKRWKSLARVFHPDKIGKGGEAFFVHLRAGFEVLEDDGKRWAYDRFGPSGLLVSTNGPARAFTRRDYFMSGAQSSGLFYLTTVITIVTLSVFNKDDRTNKFWRYMCLFFTVAIEFHLIMQNQPSTLFSFFLPNRTTFEHIAFLRQLFISSTMAITQLSPLFNPPPEETHTNPIQHANNVATTEINTILPNLKQLAEFINLLGSESLAYQVNELQGLIDTHPDHKKVNGMSNPEERYRVQGIVTEELKVDMMAKYEEGVIERDVAELFEAFVRERRLKESQVDTLQTAAQLESEEVTRIFPILDPNRPFISQAPELVPIPQQPLTVSPPTSPTQERIPLNQESNLPQSPVIYHNYVKSSTSTPSIPTPSVSTPSIPIPSPPMSPIFSSPHSLGRTISPLPRYSPAKSTIISSPPLPPLSPVSIDSPLSFTSPPRRIPFVADNSS